MTHKHTVTTQQVASHTADRCPLPGDCHNDRPGGTRNMKVWDTFLFHDETHMLELRLRELDGHVDRHVIVEAATDHRGRAKPLHYPENAGQVRAVGGPDHSHRRGPARLG